MKNKVPDLGLELMNRDAFLQEYRLLDTDLSAEPIFEQTLQLAAKICKTKSAYISIVSNEKQFILCQIGKKLKTMRKEHSICQHTIEGEEVLVIPNTLKDDRTKELELVHDESAVRFYAGAPLINEDNTKFGAICVTEEKGATANN